jgi:DNA-binding NarL/FixJ family response regulator
VTPGQKEVIATNYYPYVAQRKACRRCQAEFKGEGSICPGCRQVPEQRKQRDPRELTLREKQVVALVKQAKMNKEIAFEMGLTEGSVKQYIRRIFAKVGVRSRTALALLEGPAV